MPNLPKIHRIAGNWYIDGYRDRSRVYPSFLAVAVVDGRAYHYDNRESIQNCAVLDEPVKIEADGDIWPTGTWRIAFTPSEGEIARIGEAAFGILNSQVAA